VVGRISGRSVMLLIVCTVVRVLAVVSQVTRHAPGGSTAVDKGKREGILKARLSLEQKVADRAAGRQTARGSGLVPGGRSGVFVFVCFFNFSPMLPEAETYYY
jgi:hypothetical protein